MKYETTSSVFSLQSPVIKSYNILIEKLKHFAIQTVRTIGTMKFL